MGKSAVEQVELAGVVDRFGPVAGEQLPEDLVQVGLDRSFGDEQPVGDIPVGMPGGEEPEDLELAPGERLGHTVALDRGLVSRCKRGQKVHGVGPKRWIEVTRLAQDVPEHCGHSAPLVEDGPHVSLWLRKAQRPDHDLTAGVVIAALVVGDGQHRQELDRTADPAIRLGPNQETVGKADRCVTLITGKLDPGEDRLLGFAPGEIGIILDVEPAGPRPALGPW